ncbi:MAG TPA: polysaccharide biosynthesis protein [Polyangiaceae bacterium]|nr:polysaccharide biosynthesis protein [Polyangiaceae bacterium]
MSRFVNRGVQLAIDLAILTVAFWAAFLLRFEGEIPAQMLKRATFLTPYVILFQYAVLYLFGVPKQVWRYVALRELGEVVKAVLASAAVLLVVRLVAGAVVRDFGYAQYVLLPVGVIIVDAGLILFGIAGARVARRVQIERRNTERRREKHVTLEPLLLVGAGSAGVGVVKELLSRPDLGMEPVGFLDDDPLKQDKVIHGVRVLGPTTRLAEICAEQNVSQVCITIASARRKEIRAIVQRCDEAKVTAKIIPALSEIVSGRVELSHIRPVTIEDLLGREPVVLDQDGIAKFVKGRRVLVTGAGGSIGSEICRQIAAYEPAELLLVERSEFALFEIERDLVRRDPSFEIIPCMADVTDEARMRALMTEHRPHVVLHAAAHKHVPMMERNVGEAIKNNVFGTKLVADLADEVGVDCFVMISTDKAVRPSSVMGASKRIAEMYVQARGQTSETRFVTVRFGNVLGSVGSVVPIFKEQIARGGPVTVTHPDMQRYFMTIPEACQLVLQAATMGAGGEIFILDMGEPMKIVDLARDLIQLSGLKPGVDIEIQFTGVRPGEKLFEEIATDEEHAEKTKHPKIFVGKQQPRRFDEIQNAVTRIVHATDTASEAANRRAIARIVPEYTGAPPEAPAPVAEPDRHSSPAAALG